MFHDAVITMKGLILDTKIRSGQAVPKFTRMKIGDGVYDGTEEISESESLKSLRQEFGFSSIEIVDNKTVRLRAISDNEGITDGYYISELGVFAEDPDEGEILYSIAIGVENKMDYQPSEAELPGATCTFDTYTSVSNIETATIMVDLGAAASAKDLDDVMHPEFEDYSEEEAEVPDTSTAIGGIQSKKSIFDVFSFMKAAILGLNRDKVDASGGDIANTTVSEFSKETGEFPDLNPGEAPKTLWGKMKKFVEDFRAWYTGVCLIGHIVNNCTSGATNLPLSALQGKVLMDLYTKLNSDLHTTQNNLVEPALVTNRIVTTKPDNTDYDALLQTGWYDMYTYGVDATTVHAPKSGLGRILLRVDGVKIGNIWITMQSAREWYGVAPISKTVWYRWVYSVDGVFSWTPWKDL